MDLQSSNYLKTKIKTPWEDVAHWQVHHASER